MSFPHFLDIEYSHPDENAYPVALCWSLGDGQIKYAVLTPDDSWQPQENPPEDLPLSVLYEQGFAGPDVIRELQEDLAGQTVYVDGLDADEALVEKLFSTYGEEAGFEVCAMGELFYQFSLEELLEMRREQAEQAGLELRNAEEGVLSMLYLARALGEIDA